ncbi:hypothetical protein BDZ45DRAFT_731600 [Acephala macrosclerotiorum]|nr:hypothetical protein BDZ45DRAFT_731600 [Acephala macrosclerotiorum]
MHQVVVTPLSCNTLRLAFGNVTHQVELPILCNDDDHRILRWYFEDYVEKDPFQKSKAEEAKAMIEIYGQKLVQALQLSRLDIKGGDIQFDIMAGDMDDIFWETLEQMNHWPSSIATTTVLVTRRVDCTIPSTLAPREPTCQKCINILVVISRPQMDRDIPHRFVSSTIIHVAELAKGRARVEIVRPGTFEAFVQHLDSHPKGYFDIVHFDMHGNANKSRATLSFLRMSQTGQIASDPRSAREVSDVLVKYEVRQAVFNACQSASVKGGPDSNIAMSMVRYGVLAVVAMAYKIASSAVDQFVRRLYTAILLDGMSVPEAAMASRTAMLSNPNKQTRFGTSIAVYDHVVLRCYLRRLYAASPLLETGTEWSNHKSDIPPNSSQDIIGRENDILLLETKLLMDSNVGLLWGDPGTGKTATLSSVGKWWRKTHLIERSAYFDLEAGDVGREATDMSQIQEILAESLLGSKDKADEVIPYLATHRSIIVLDNLDAWKMPEGSSKAKQRTLLKDFLSRIHKSRSFFIIISRHSEAWLERIAAKGKRSFSHHLDGLTTNRGMGLFVQLLTDAGMRRFTVQTGQSKYLEAIVKLVDGNPLALKLLAGDFHSKKVDIKEYFHGLLAGDPVELSEKGRGLHDFRSVTKFQQYVSLFREEALEIITSDFIPSGSSGNEVRDPPRLPPISPSVLGIFWTAIPTEDIWRYFMLLALITMLDKNSLPFLRPMLQARGIKLPSSGNLEAAKIAFMFMQQQVLDTMKGPMFEHWESLRESLLQAMKNMDFLTLPNLRNPNTPKKSFYHISPILTIVARSQPEYVVSVSTLREALFYFQNCSALEFPHSRHYWSPQWSEPRREIGLSFYNYYAAALAALHKEPGDLMIESTIVVLLSILSKGVFVDKGRYELLSLVFEEILVRGIVLLDYPPEISESNITLYLSLQNCSPHSSSPETPESFAKTARTVLKVAIANQILAVIGGIKGGTFDSEKPDLDGILEKVRPHIEGILAELDSYSNEKVYGHMRMTLEYAWNMLSLKCDNIDDWWQARQDYVTWASRVQGQRFPEKQHSPMDIPRSVNSMAIPLAPVMDVKLEVERLLKSKPPKTTEARQIVQMALEAELSTGSNQVDSKAHLLLLLANIDKEDEHWEDAIANTNMAYDLEDSLPRRISTETRIDRERNLVILYDKATDVDTTTHLVKRLLRRANQLHFSNPALEIEALLAAAKVSLTQRVDWEFSAIYLLSRVIVTYHRAVYNSSEVLHTGNGNKLPYLHKIMKITNSTKPQWVLGPESQRPQSVAIYFLSTVFGQFIFNILNLRRLQRSPIFRQTFGNINPVTPQELQATQLRLTMLSMKQPDWADRAMDSLRNADSGASKEEMFSLETEIMFELATRIFGDSNQDPGSKHFAGIDFKKQREWFTFFYNCGEKWLSGVGEGRCFAKAPWMPVTSWGTVGGDGTVPGVMAVPNEYQCPTSIMMKLAGYDLTN